ncbi:MAG: DNA/RNA non-specific endonuclease [Verrucomicrobiae bacterium]|nr:DNA/RNA non-specific endonuclease [Verrucomicrobiae bacterium]
MKIASSCILLLLSVVFASATIDSTLQMQLGNPSGAIADTSNHVHFLIQRSIETLDYNDTLGEPNWASWDLTAADCNSAVARQDSFAPDTNGLPAGFHIVGANDYSHSGYDRGHLCPSADRNDSTNDNNMTFLMDNMMPQAPDNNEGIWGNFEDYCRAQAQSAANYEVLIICGPSGFTGAKINTNGYVSIPQYTWKIAVIVPPGAGSATNRITATNRVIAIKVPNTNGVSSIWQNFITSAAQIEVDTGLTFFTALPPAVAVALRAKVDGQTNSPPAIFGFSPVSGAPGTNVVITGTNFISAYAVTFNGVNAGSFTVNSSNQITAVVPTNASTGFISVSSPAGVAVTSSNFTVAGGGGGGTIYSGVLAGWDVSTQTAYGSSPLAPTTAAPNLAVGGLTRGTGVKTSGTGAAGGWGGTSFTNVSATSAVASNLFVSFSLTASNGYKVSYTTLNRLDYRRSSTGPTDGILQFQVGTNAYVDITNLSYSSSANSGATNPPIDLSGFAALQNIGANINVTFRIANYNGDSTGKWYVFDYAGSTAPDLSVQGTVTQVVTVTNLPGFQSFSFAEGNPSLTITGTVAVSYTILASTNLAATNWTTLLTTNPGSVPFTFVDTNRLPLRFYRVQNP